MRSELERLIYENAFALLGKGMRIELHNPHKEKIEYNNGKADVEYIKSSIHRTYSDKNFKIHGYKGILSDNSEKYFLQIYHKQRLPLIPIHYRNKLVFSYYKRTKHDRTKDKVLLSNCDDCSYWVHLLEDTAVKKCGK